MMCDLKVISFLVLTLLEKKASAYPTATRPSLDILRGR